MAMSGVNPVANYFAMQPAGRASQALHYQPVQRQAQSLIDTFRQSTERTAALQRESTGFLNEYTGGLNALNSEAGRLAGSRGLQDAQRGGALGEAAARQVAGQAGRMVSQYNSSLEMVNENRGRGPGVQSQAERMERVSALAGEMETAGMAVNEDGTLRLDEERLAAALQDGTSGAAQRAAQMLGGEDGLAAEIQQSARAGLNTSSASLVSDDVARWQGARDNDPMRTLAQSLRGGGAYAMNNSAAIGILMNMVV